MSVESDVRDWLQSTFPDANVDVASEEAEASPPARLEAGEPDKITASVETVPVTAYGGEVVYHESVVAIDIRSTDSRRAKRMGRMVQALSGTRGLGGDTIGVDSESSFWDVELAATKQFRTVETLSVRSR